MFTSDEIYLLIIGAVIGALLEILFSRLINLIRERYKIEKTRKQWKKSERALNKYKYLAHGFEIVQLGWENGIFREDQLIITDEQEYRLPRTLIKHIRKPQENAWFNEGKRNNKQLGVFEILPIRETESSVDGSPTHTLVLRGQRYKYFDSLSTHFTYLNKTKGYETLTSYLDQYLKDNKEDKPNRQNPIRIFPSALSVGLSLFCENGNCLVLTKRTKSTSSGGHISGGTTFNAVGENISHEKDVVPYEFEGKTRISPYKTAIRGLYEEIGIEHEHYRNSEISLHSFIWDRRILDYKFFGLGNYDIHRSEVERLFRKAPDYSESRGIIFLETATPEQCNSVIEKIISERNNWSSEAIFCTIASLLVLENKLEPETLYEELEKAEL